MDSSKQPASRTVELSRPSDSPFSATPVTRVSGSAEVHDDGNSVQAFQLGTTFNLMPSPNRAEELRLGDPALGGSEPPPLLSVAIITCDEESNLARTLASVRFAGEVIVVDSGSRDRTVEIARSFGAQVFVEPWKGFSAQKNSAIRKCTGTWILSLDADEELSEDLQRQLRTLLPTNPPVDAFFLRRRNLFLGRWMKHGGYYPDPKLRLFRRNAANFASAARFSDRPVHETITFDGASDTLDFDLIHHAYPTLESYLAHMDRYSTLGAELLVQQRRRSRSLAAFYWNVLLVPQLTFTWNYLFRLGFLDGREGLLLHLYHSAYVSWKYAKAWRMAREPRAPLHAQLSGARPASASEPPAQT